MTEALQKVRQMARRSHEARSAFLEAVRAAHKAGATERAIGAAAGLSGPRIHQILREEK